MLLERSTFCLLTVLLAACSQNLPTYDAVILTSYEQYDSDVARLREELKSMPAAERVFAAITISDVRCDRFFNELDRLRTDARWAANRLTSASTAVPGLLKAASASSLSVAVVPAALGFVEAAVTDYQEIYLLSRFNGAVREKWDGARLQAEKTLLDIFATPGQLVSDQRVNREIYKYSRLCLRSQLTSWLEQAVNGGKIVADPGGKGTPSKGAAAESAVGGGLMTIPNYVVQY